ncbi:MAG: hypothetical protein HYY85_19200, partial [Deltaproteobacteria bacterium]|nr:hypothetical protein [Deltaproteobacteria bacterium]
VLALAGGAEGWLLARASVPERVLAFGAALFLIKPGLVTDLAGIGLLGLALLSQRLRYGPGVLEVGEVLRSPARQPRVAVVAVEEPLAKGGGAGSA